MIKFMCALWSVVCSAGKLFTVGNQKVAQGGHEG